VNQRGYTIIRMGGIKEFDCRALYLGPCRSRLRLSSD
jgi:hypothetical protein